MDSLCDRCRLMLAVRYCEIDGVYLCFPCDADFHSSDALRSSHSRSLVAHRGLIKPAARINHHQSLPVVSVSSNNLSSAGFPTPGVVGTPTLPDPLPPPEGGSLAYAYRDNGGLKVNAHTFYHPLTGSSSSVIPVPTPDCNATVLPCGADQGSDQGSFELDHPDEMWLRDLDSMIEDTTVDEIFNILGSGDDLPASCNLEQGKDQGRCGSDHPDEMALLPSEHILDKSHIDENFDILEKDNLPASHSSEQGKSAALRPSSFPDGLSPTFADDNGTGGNHLCSEMWLRVPDLVINESDLDEILNNLRKDDFNADHNGIGGNHVCPEMGFILPPTTAFNYQESPMLLSTQCNQYREKAVARYRELKPRRRCEKRIVYPARKARAEARKRVHGRFVKDSGEC